VPRASAAPARGTTRRSQATPGSQSNPAVQTTPPPSPREQAPSGLSRWLDPATAPIIPVPEIDQDPSSGTTLGIIPTYLVSGSNHQITRIIAPDVIYNQNFGWGARGRIFAYPSQNTQWSIEGGGKQRVESEFDGEYASGILRQDRWSFNASVIYDRSGSPRFFGTGNYTRLSGQTDYTDQQKYIQTTLGFNFNHTWQLGYQFRARTVDISPGKLAGIPSIDELYPNTVIHAERQEILNRLLITYDTRDDVVVPTRGAEWVAYAGAASSAGMINSSLYSEVGIDGRNFWSLPANAVLAFHMALRYMPRTARTRNIPFWALSSIGGDEAVIGGDQPLRGFPEGRFRDRNSSAFSLEYRKRVASVNAFSTSIAIELAPFLDMARVFNSFGTDPLSGLHKIVGVGVRGIALPFIVGFVDVGYGNEGPAVFTGLNYPF
ncbi:MAG: BamA/TamA family outer membrane protein, partial [Steroidobacteraceae bacterium]